MVGISWKCLPDMALRVIDIPNMLQSTILFSWSLPRSCDHTPPRQAPSAQGPATHYIPQCYATRPHEQATTPYEPTPCGGPPSLYRHAPSYIYRATARPPCPGAPCWAPCSHPLEHPPSPVLVHRGVCRAHDAEPSILARGWPGQSYVRHATARARSSHALLAGQPRRPHAYLVTWWVPNRAMATMARPPRQPRLPQTLLVTLQPLICTYKATHQSGGQLPFHHATDVITCS